MTNTDRLAQALRALVAINEQHNVAVESVIGRPLGWKDTYLDAARAALAEYDAIASLAPAAVEVTDEMFEQYKAMHECGMKLHNKAECDAGRTPRLQQSLDAGCKYALRHVLTAQVAALTAQCEGLTKQNRILEIKNAGTLANNLCPDHRDKQIGKPCLACTIETLQRKLDSAIAAGNGEGV